MKLFDLWSVIHFGMWAFIGSTIAAWKEPPLWVHWLYGLGGSYLWEVVEHFLQRKYPAAWSNRIEHWSNAWVGDPIANLLGVTFGWFVVAFYRKRFRLW